MLKRFFTVLLCFFCLFIFYACSEQERTYKDGTVVDGIDISGITVSAAKQGLLDYHKKLLSEITYTVKGAANEKKLSASELGISFDTEGALARAMEDGGEIRSELKIDKAKARNPIETISAQLTTAPVDAYAEYDACGEFKFYEAKNGSTPDIDALVNSLSEAVKSRKSQELTAQMSTTYPTGSTYAELVAQNSLISEFTTYFNKSPHNAENRVKNIKKAAGLINGTVVEVGKNFDTNAILGDRNQKNGWYKAPGIRNGKYELEYGGGVCQVSTTVYNAVLLANLEVLERSPHSWPVGYIDIGRDATISTGGPNLIFSNNTASPITIGAVINDEKQCITVRIYGTKPKDYAKVEISSKQTGTIPTPKTEYVKDKTLRIGEYVTDRKARAGKTASTYRTFYDADGNVIKTETVTNDKYKAFAAIVHYNN